MAAVRKEDCHIAVGHTDSAVDHYIDLAAVYIDPEMGHIGFVTVHYIEVAVVHIDLGVVRIVVVHYIELVVVHIDLEADRTGLAVGRIDCVVDHCTGLVEDHCTVVAEDHIELEEGTDFLAGRTDLGEGIGLVEGRIDYCCKKDDVVVEADCRKEHHTVEVVRTQGLVEGAYCCCKRAIHGCCMEHWIRAGHHNNCRLTGCLVEVS